MTADPRSEKVAIVPEAELVARLPALRAAGYGLMQLPPESLDARTAGDWLAQIAEQVAEYRRNGYEVVVSGDGGTWGTGLDAALAQLGLEPLPPSPV